MRREQSGNKNPTERQDSKQRLYHLMRHNPQELRWEDAEQLRQDCDWKLLLELSRMLQNQRDTPSRGTALFLMALRATEDQMSALEYLEDREDLTEDIDVAIQWASLLCELGDYAPLLNISETSRSGSESQLIDFLILLAWAHENSGGAENAQKAASLYERALALLKIEAEKPPHAYETPHPEATVRPPGIERNMNTVRTLWCRRGYAEALFELSEKDANPSQLWTGIIRDSKELAENSLSDPYVQRIVAWCHFRLAQYDESLTAYRKVLEFASSKYSPQFEEAIVFFSMGRVNAAVDQYEKAIRDLRDISSVRRCGLLRSAFWQFAKTVLHDRMLERTTHGMEVLEDFGSALESTLKQIRKALPGHARRISEDIQPIIRDLKRLWTARSNEEAPIEVLDWTEAKIVGFQDPGVSLCGLFYPLIEYRGSKFICVTEKLSPDAVMPTIQRRPEPERTKRLRSSGPPKPGTMVVYFSEAARKILNTWSVPFPATIRTQLNNLHDEAEMMACIDASEATAAMNEIAKELIQKSFQVFLGATEGHGGVTEHAALLAFYAAQKEVTIYQAALLYHCLSKEPIDLYAARTDGLLNSLPSAERMSQLSHSFCEREKRIPSPDIATRGPYMVNQSPHAPMKLAVQVLKRATEISSLKDEGSRALEADWAAAEMELVLGNSDEINLLQQKLANILPRATMWYLSDNLDTLALALKPAFYCAMELSGLSKPTLDVFAFYKAQKSSKPEG